MHEHLLTRGDLGQNWKLKREIMVPENCILVHPGTCHLAAQHTDSGKVLGVRHLLKVEGYDAMMYWLEFVASFARSNIAQEAITFVQSIYQEDSPHE